MYPAFNPPNNENETIKESPVLRRANGHHEVFVESRCHSEHPGTVRVSQLIHVINAYLDRLAVLPKKSYVQHVAIFKNHGREAGAYLLHAHTQLIVSPIIPTYLKKNLRQAKNTGTKTMNAYSVTF